MRIRFYRSLIVSLCLCVPIAPNLHATELKTHYQEESVPKYVLDASHEITAAGGVCVDILRALELELPGIRITADYAAPFKRILHDLESGTIDLFCGMTRTKERELKYFYLEPPLYELNFVLTVRADDDVVITSFDDIRRLAPKNIILTNAGTGAERFLRRQDGLRIDAGAADIPTNLRKLRKRRGRFYFFHDMGVQATIKSEYKGRSFRVLPVSFRRYYQYAGFSKKSPNAQMIEPLGRALKRLETTGQLQKIFDAYVDID